MKEWSRAEIIALASLAVSLVVGVPGVIAAWLVVPEFRALVAPLRRKVGVVGRRLASVWQLLCGCILLLADLYVASSMLLVVRSVIAIIGLTAASAWLLLTGYQRTRYRRRRAWVFAGGPLVIFSAEETGEFSYRRGDGWRPAVACDPGFHGWPRMDPAQWVWISKEPTIQQAQQGEVVWHRLDLELPEAGYELREATLRVMVDDWLDVLVNERLVQARITGFDEPINVDLASHMRRGRNTVLMRIENSAIPGSTPQENPSGIVYGIVIR